MDSAIFKFEKDIYKILHNLIEIKESDEEDEKRRKIIKKEEGKILDTIIKPGFICLDIGFHYGWFSYNFLKNIGKKGTVFSWEPNKFLFDKYLKKWPFINLKRYNEALSDRIDTKKFYILGDEGTLSGFNSLEKPKDRSTIYETINIKTNTLDNWWNKNNKIHVDVIKIDCEEHDFNILQGGSEMLNELDIRYIFIEEDSEEISEFMKKRHYTIDNELSKKIVDTVWIKEKGINV